MSKLFSGAQPVVITAPPPIHLLKTDYIEDEMVSLENHTAAYCSVGNIADSVACESYTFVTPGNTALYNEYVSLLAKVHKIEAPKRVDVMAFESDSVVTVNASIALEGWMADIWNKIKGAFKGISTAIKKFSTDYFTTLDRVKKGLENLTTVLKKTDKDLEVGKDSSEAPSALVSLMKGHADVSPSTMREALKTTKELVAGFDTIGKASKTVINTGFLSADYISSIKRLKDQALSAAETIKKNDGNRDGPLDKFGANNKSITAANKKLTDIQREAEVDAAQGDSNVNAVSDMDQGESANHEEALKVFKAFADGVIGELTPLIDKPLMGGKVIKAVKVTDDSKLEIETASIEEDPSGFTPATKSELLSFIKSIDECITTAEATVKIMSTINDEVDKAIETIDKLTADIDKVDPERYGKFKNVITQSLRTRLKLLQSFFTNYNKLGKNSLEITMHSGKAVIAYCTASMAVYA